MFLLDHINIRTLDLEASIGFYRDIVGMTMVSPLSGDPAGGAYFCDEAGRAVIHVLAAEHAAPSSEPVFGAAQHGKIDHVALLSDGSSAALVERLKARDIAFDRLEVAATARELYFVSDPNGIMVELSFPLQDTTVGST